MQFVRTSHIFSDIQSRDAILIKSVVHLNKKNILTLKGTVYSELIEPEACDTIRDFELCFYNIKMFDCVNLDLSKLDSKMTSNFMLIENSDFIEENHLDGFYHYILSTYSYVYQVVAQSYTVDLN